MMKPNSLCDIPEDLLTTQLLIETIPSLVILAILLISNVVCIIWYLHSKDKLSTTYQRTAIVAMCIVFFPLWYKCSFIAEKAATNIFNSEYAALVKFAQGCPESLRPH